ncbi:MAG: sensor histidine kinase [Cytophagales bacterium]|nr:sensor histidine kinase [Cytophagales bacterium]
MISLQKSTDAAKKGISKYLMVFVWLGVSVFIFSGMLWLGWKYSLARTLFLLLVLLVFSYVNTKWLIPKFLLVKKKKILYIVVVLALYGVTIYLSLIFDRWIWQFVTEEAIHEILSYRHPSEFLKANPELVYTPIYAFAFESIYIFITLFVSSSIKLSRVNKLRKEKADLLRIEKTDAELRFLKSQINPHFLFNALNDIYTMSYMKMDQAPETVAKLSDMLRYLLYDCSEDQVELQKEIEYIKNYIDFKNLKAPHENHLELQLKIKNPKIHIAPMLFEPFIENAYKFSQIDESTDGFVHIVIEQKDKRLLFLVINSIADKQSRTNVGGIGIKNVKKRLVLTYPEKHKLTYGKKGQEFFVKLELELNHGNE